jgi:hypothetical protein
VPRRRAEEGREQVRGDHVRRQHAWARDRSGVVDRRVALTPDVMAALIDDASDGIFAFAGFMLIIDDK